MKILTLDDLSKLAQVFRSKLRPFKRLFLENEYVESLASEDEFRQIRDDLDAYLRTQPIRAYHCTQEHEPGYFVLALKRLPPSHSH